MIEYKEVTQAEFRAFLAAYPTPLEHHCTTICDPESHGYYDFTNAPEDTPDPYIYRQAYCTYGDERGLKDRFMVRVGPNVGRQHAD